VLLPLDLGSTGGIAMAQDRLEEIAAVTGEEFKPALGKLWAMLIGSALMILVGAVIVYLWWFEVEFLGRVLSTKAGVVGLIAMPLGAFLTLVAVVFVVSAKRLIVGDDCVQLLSGERVAVHIPYQNVGETYTTGDSGAGVVGLVLRDRDDPATRVPTWTRDRYEIQVLAYRQPLDHIHASLSKRLAAFRAGRKAAGTR
jgi:hypothetical protein